MECNVKHTPYQPTDAEWICPKCKVDVNSFYIQDSENHDCAKLHINDELGCTNCGYYITGKQFANMLQKRKNLISCPHCHGTGLIQKESKQGE